MVDKRVILDGLHQYTMHLYNTAINSGLSEIQARSEVTKLLFQEAKVFDSRVDISPKLRSIMEEVLGRSLTEEERFRLNNME